MNANKTTYQSLCWLGVALIWSSAVMAQASGGDPPSSVEDIPEGYFLFEGDILLPLDYFAQRGTYGTSLWPGGIVPFQFDGGVTPQNQQNMLNAMAAWEAVANVDFVPRNGEANFLHIQNAAGNSSEGIGMAGGQHDIKIASWGTFGVLTHELGHALGFWHEQSRADRDGFIVIDFDNVQQSGCDGNSCNSQFQIRGSGGEYGPYDFDSVMHYDACAFSICCPLGSTCPCAPGCETILVLPPFDVAWQSNIGQRSHLSVFDALTMSFLYPQPDWRFVEQGAGGSDAGTFKNPYLTWSRAMSQTPTGGTLWVLEPDAYAAVGTYSRAMTWRAGYGTVTLGN